MPSISPEEDVRGLVRGFGKETLQTLALRCPHVEWWGRFWNQSRVDVPDAAVLRHYYIVRYFYGAASRRGAPPMPLQGV